MVGGELEALSVLIFCYVLLLFVFVFVSANKAKKNFVPVLGAGICIKWPLFFGFPLLSGKSILGGRVWGGGGPPPPQIAFTGFLI